MEYEYRVEDRKDHAMVILPQKVIIPYSDNFEPAMREAYEMGYKTIILDCSDMKMFDTAGIAYVAVYQKKIKDRGGELKMVNVKNDYVKHLFRMIEFNKLVSIEEV